MAAGGWRDWTEGELVTEALFQDIQDSIAFIFASESAANSALTRKVEGTQFFDTGADKLKVWNGSAWIEVGAIPAPQVDQFLLPSNLTSDTDPITTWQRPTGTLQTGSGMTLSTGVFSFPSTGIWQVSIMGRLNPQVTGDSGNLRIHTTDDNGSSFDIVVDIRNEDEAARRSNDFGTTFIDVQNTSNDKVKISFDEVNNCTLEGASTDIRTGVFFQRIGDT
jgi:hypothetical protein|tara:strand:- start:528 stop:1190 length:663 start_codon:yes stop_codon:yes gene_type:complete